MILVTGGSGLLGSHLVESLTAQGFQVRALYRSNIPVFNNSVKAEWVKGDILETFSLSEAMNNVTHVYHCAGMVSFHPKNKRELFQVNVEGTANVVNTCFDAGVEKLLFVSSVAALGRKRENAMINETVQWSEESNNSEYGRSKFLAEMQVWRGVGEGLNAVIVNPSIILGAGNWNEGSTKIFNSVYKEFPWYTDGVSGFVDVKDVVQTMILLMQSDISSDRFIINGVNLSYKELFDLIAKNFNKKLPSGKVTPFIASLVWRLEAIKGLIKNKQPLLTKETAATAQAKVYFDNHKLLKALPAFSYTMIEKSVERICMELKEINNLP